jgi:PAS domain S-box-containing protein
MVNIIFAGEDGMKFIDNKEKELEELQELCKRLNLIINAKFDEITIADRNGVFVDVQRQCEENFGIPEGDLIGKSAYELEQKGVFSKSVTLRVLQEKRKISMIQNTAAGKRLMVTGIPEFDDQGNVIGVINVSQDITGLEQIQQKLLETEEMLEWFKEALRKEQAVENPNMVANSKEMIRVLNLIRQVANVEASILMLGETGVGKSFLARFIHQISDRREKPFVQINCGAIPETLLESELFGYEAGAFTGADRRGKKGLMEVAEIPLHLQVKLLNVLQDRTFYKIGGTNPLQVKARFISATNKDIKKLVAEGKFREDLYYRLNVVPIEIPPLRKRTEDLPILIRYFLDKFNEKYRACKQLSSDAYQLLCDYDWPGNIRELENTMERIVITSQKSVIEKDDLLEMIKPQVQTSFEITEIVPLKEAVEEIERQLLQKAMAKYKTTRAAAKALKVNQSTVVKKLKKLRQCPH